MQATWTWTPQSETQHHAGSDTKALDGCAWTEEEKADCPAAKRNPAAFGVLAQSPVIALVLLFWNWICGRIGRSVQTTTRPSMRTLSHLSLGGRKTITLVEVEGVRYLVGGGADTVTAIVPINSETHGFSLTSVEEA